MSMKSTIENCCGIFQKKHQKMVKKWKAAYNPKVGMQSYYFKTAKKEFFTYVKWVQSIITSNNCQ